jgi:hypothetical protein
MNDTQIAESLRRLPRTNASPSFTSDVLRTVRQERAERRPARLSWRTAAAFAMAACLVIIIGQIALLRHDRQERMAALRAEQRQLAAELQDVKRGVPATEPPVVVLENDEGTRVIVELTDDDHTSPTPSKVIY